jgi:hypothetical protein
VEVIPPVGTEVMVIEAGCVGISNCPDGDTTDVWERNCVLEEEVFFPIENKETAINTANPIKPHKTICFNSFFTRKLYQIIRIFI